MDAGNDPKNRHFRTVSQGMTYDPEAEFVKLWIPSLRGLPAEQAHAPWAVGAAALDADEAATRQNRGEAGSSAVEMYAIEPMLSVATQMKYVPPDQ